jgi:hypothetical protein
MDGRRCSLLVAAVLVGVLAPREQLLGLQA